MSNRSDANTILLAKKLYVYEGQTLQQIADTIGKAEKTVRNWKNKYDWELEKAEYLDSISNLPRQIYEDYCMVRDNIRKTIRENKQPSPQMVKLFNMLFEQIPQAKEVELAAGIGTDNQPKNKEDIRKILTEVVRKEVGLE